MYNWRNLGMGINEMMNRSLTPEGDIYKWVLVGTEYRFIRVVYAEHHGMLVNDGEQASDAGTIHATDSYWRVMGQGSTTLKVGCSSEAEEGLRMAFSADNRPQRERI